MVIRRCPQCHTTSDDSYGFCIKCGCEFPKIDETSNLCPLCNYPNPQEADYCVKCGTPLIFKNNFENNDNNPNPIILNRDFDTSPPRTSRIIIVLGYLFSLLGGLIGLIIAIYLVTRKDPVAKKHGKIQLAIFAFYIILIIIFVATGAITMSDINHYAQLFGGNFTNMTGL
ncbi:MAG: zinc ribbon domain-containing protein [Methanobrevibacter sp.]|nr:zinc ribbon domain-containing protein [Methanobrevibacter sp.]